MKNKFKKTIYQWVDLLLTIKNFFKHKGISMATKHSTDSNFDTDVIKAAGPIVVDFWAEWCGPCRAISPALEEISNSLEGQVDIVKVNIDDNPVTPQSYGVRGIPTLLMFKNGEVVAEKIGALPKSQLEQWVKENL